MQPESSDSVYKNRDCLTLVVRQPLEVRKEQNREFGKAVSVEAFVTIAREWQWMV